MKIRTGDLLAVPWEINRCDNRVILDKGTRKTFLQKLGRGACLRLPLGRFLDEKALQSFLDNRFLVRELAVLDLLSKKPLKIVCESDVHDGESCQPLGVPMAPA
jgi:hypothetical protein